MGETYEQKSGRAKRSGITVSENLIRVLFGSEIQTFLLASLPPYEVK